MSSSALSVLVTLPTGLREAIFSAETEARLESIADVTWNERDEQFDAQELTEQLPGVDVVLTGWGTPTFTESVIDGADDLALLVHTAGSVASYVTDALYDHGVTVCSANRPMARFVAELTLAHVLASQRHVSSYDRSMKNGEDDRSRQHHSLFGKTVGLVGLGTVGRYLLPLLEPFDVTVRVYDPFVPPVEIAEYDFVEKATLRGALVDSAVVSIHAARTPETIGMVGAEELASMPDGALLVNTARAAIVDEDALLAELSSGRIRAALDVYHEEPLPKKSPLRGYETAQLTPHIAGGGPQEQFAAAMVDEIERFADGRALQHEIPREQADLMTR